MNPKKHQHNWYLDVVLMVAYLFCFYLDLTGIVLHEWLGVGITLLALVHLLVHWDWVRAVARKFFTGGQKRNRVNLVIDFLLALGYVLIFETGLMISTWTNLVLDNYITWLDIHIYASFITLGLTILTVGLHWRWIVRITEKIFGDSFSGKVQHSGFPVLAQQPVRVDQNRRKFLMMMGIVGLGSALAAINVTTDKNTNSVQAVADELLKPETATSGKSTEVVIDDEPAAVASANQGPEVTLEDGPEFLETESAATTCTVRCRRGCSFPGQCRRYVDENANQKCDLGECM